MKILRYEKKRNGMYQVFFDNGNDVDIHEEIILKYQLLLKKEIDNNLVDKMLEENKKYIAYDLAIKYLAKRMRTAKEIREYLLKYEIDRDTIKEVNELLKKNGYLNDDIYCASYINDRILLSNDGPEKIKDKLLELGIREDTIVKALDTYTDSIQKERITRIVDKEIKINRNKSIFVLKNKILQKLYLLGYRKDLSVEIVNNAKYNTEKDAYQIQYKKVYDKLSKKYSGKELEYHVNQKMYSLGFRNDFE